jgi:hypothetical protein
MDWMDGLNTFHFDNHEALDYEVDAIAECDFLSVENYWQSDCTNNGEAALS